MAPDLIDDKDDAQGSTPEPLLKFLSHHRQSSQRRRERNHRLGKRRRTIAVLLGIVAAFGLVAINVVIWGNFTHIRFVSHTPATTASPKTSVAGTSRHRGPAHSGPSPVSRGAKSPPKKVTPPKPIRVSLTAVRNDSWVEVRAGSSTARVLFEGVVHEGESVRVKGQRLWARFGSLANFDVSINGRAVHPALNGTLDTIITPSGIRAASAQTPSG